MSRHLDPSTTTQMAKIMVQYGRPSRSSRKEFVRSPSGRTVMGKAIWENPVEIRLGERFPLGNAYSYTAKKRLFLSVYVDDIKVAGKKQNINPMWKVLNKEVDMGEPTFSLDHVYLGCLNPEFPQEQLKNYHARKIWVSLRGHMTWRAMPRNVWNDIVSWRTKRLNNSTKYQLHALMTITSKKKNWNPWENGQKCALKLFWNACTWLVLEDPIFYGQWTNLHDQLPNRPKPVTNDSLVWYPKFITHVTTSDIVMWETLQNNAGWDCFETPILQEILRTQNLIQVEHCAFLDVIHLFQSAGCVRNKLQFRTAQQNQKSSPWMQV